jgi:hypothetical protein
VTKPAEFNDREAIEKALANQEWKRALEQQIKEKQQLKELELQRLAADEEKRLAQLLIPKKEWDTPADSPKKLKPTTKEPPDSQTWKIPDIHSVYGCAKSKIPVRSARIDIAIAPSSKPILQSDQNISPETKPPVQIESLAKKTLKQDSVQKPMEKIKAPENKTKPIKADIPRAENQDIEKPTTHVNAETTQLQQSAQQLAKVFQEFKESRSDYVTSPPPVDLATSAKIHAKPKRTEIEKRPKPYQRQLKNQVSTMEQLDKEATIEYLREIQKVLQEKKNQNC